MKSLKQKLKELTVYDFKKQAVMSDITSEYKKIRNQMIGYENRVTKLVDIEINIKDNYVIFYFLTEPTPMYPDNHIYKTTQPKKNFALKPDNTYTMLIKVLDFFDWLETSPHEITIDDIKDVLRVADVQVFSDDPSFHWQGMNYKLSQLGSSVYPTNIEDKVWGKRHKDNNFMSKHLGGLLDSIDFFIPQMASKFRKEYKKYQ